MHKHIYIVRHCKAEGQEPEAKLTEKGVQDAYLLVQFFKDKSIDYIISSPYLRAHHTILPFAEEFNVAIHFDNRLTERVLCNSSHSNWLDMLKQSFKDLDLYFEGGESSHTAMNRIVQVVEEALDSESKNIVIVSHGNLIALLLKYFDNRIGFEEWQALSNPDVFKLSFMKNKKTLLQHIYKI